MKIALVHDWLTGMRGGEKCLEVLCRRFPDATLSTLLHKRGAVSAAIEGRTILRSPLGRLPQVHRYYRYLLPLMPWAAGRLKMPADVDVVLSFSHAVAKSVRVPEGVPHVCYCFTPMRYAWHLRSDYLGAPSAGIARDQGPHEPSHRYTTSLRRMLSRLVVEPILDRIRDWDRRTSTGVTHFIAISRTVAARIDECYGRSSQVIYPPVDTDFYTPALPVAREDFLLCVSALVPYKRIDLAIRACNQLRRPLVVIGSGPESLRLAALAGPTVRLLGWRSDEEIRDHLRRCRALLFPGHEDFGIVPLEAQACGTPVIAYARGGALETVLEPRADRPGTGIFFADQTADALCASIRWLDEHPQAFSTALARRQAMQFSTPRYEQEMLDYLQRVLAGRAVEPARGSRKAA